MMRKKSCMPNGNMIKDRNKGISNIRYNYLNLPTQIEFEGINNKITYLYNSVGQKLKKTVVYSDSIKIVDYLDGFQYASGVLQFFPHAEGYVKATPTDKLNTNYGYNYVFNYTDHLGNIRVSYSKDPQTHQLKILEENHTATLASFDLEILNFQSLTRPFGLKHSVYAAGRLRDFEVDFSNPEGEHVFLTPVTKTEYQYKFNGKELQDELGLSWYDYGARNYDPALGRWNVIDPMSDKYWSVSPYAYVLNNPVYFIDPDGMQVDTGDPEICEGCLVELEEAVITAKAPEKKQEDRRDPIFGYNYDDEDFKRTSRDLHVAVANYKGAQQIDEGIHFLTITAVTWPLGGPFARGASFLLKPIVTRTGTIIGELLFPRAVAEGIEQTVVSKFLVNPSKFDFFFGRVVSGNAHNITRSAQNLKDLNTLGITSESQLMNVFSQALESGAVLSTKTSQFGTTVTRSVNIGDKGAINVGFFYQGGNMSSTPSISTIIPKIFK